MATRRITRINVVTVFYRWVQLWLTTIVGLAIIVSVWGGTAWLLSSIWIDGSAVSWWATVIGVTIAIGSYVFSEPLVAFSLGAKRQDDDHELTQLVHECADKAHMRHPRVYILPDDSMNACAFGVYVPLIPLPFLPSGAIAFTRGIVRSMNENQLKGVICHELAHLQSGDMIILTMASALAAAVGIMVDVLLRMPGFLGGTKSRDGDDNKGLAGCAGMLIAIVVFLAVLAVLFILTQVVIPLVTAFVSRQRELLADALSALILGSPDPLISALQKLERSATRVGSAGRLSKNLFFMQAVGDDTAELFADHPATSKRIAELKALAE